MTVLAAFLAAGPGFTPAAAQSGSARAVFEKYDLLGTFAWDCSKPASKENRYYINRALDNGQMQRDQMSGPAERDWVTIIDKASELRANEIAVSGLFNLQEPSEAIWRVERGRQLLVEATIGGKKTVTAGRILHSNVDSPWIIKCALLPAAQAQSASVQALFDKHNLLGTFAFDCAKPVSRDNRYYVHRPLDAGLVQRDMMSSPTTRDFAVIWERGSELRSDQIALSGLRDGQPVESVYLVEPGRVRVLESTFAGRKEIVGGRFVDGGAATPWAIRCDAPGR
jgi:hypothetical protein